MVVCVGLACSSSFLLKVILFFLDFYCILALFYMLQNALVLVLIH